MLFWRTINSKFQNLFFFFTVTEKKSQAKPNLLQTECLWRVSYKPPSFKYFLQWTSQPSKPLHTPYWDNLQGNKCIWESKVFWAFPLVSISQLHVFFKHWKCGMFYRIRSLEISVSSNIVSLFIFLRDVNMVSCMNCLELWGDMASPAALNRCSEDRNF